MANPEYKKARWQEVQDGTKVWEKGKLCPDDDDTFRTLYVDPLQELSDEGRFEIQIIKINFRGKFDVPIAVEIVSAINFDP
jgi:hypothetical protein